MTRDRKKAVDAATGRIYSSFRDDLRSQMDDAGLSARRLAAAAGMDHGFLGRILSADVQPSVETMARLCVT